MIVKLRASSELSWAESFALMYITFLFPPEALNCSDTIVVLPAVCRLFFATGLQLDPEYGWQLTKTSTDLIVCLPVWKMLPPSSACFVRASSLTCTLTLIKIPVLFLTASIEVQRISGPRGAMYGCVATLAAYLRTEI